MSRLVSVFPGEGAAPEVMEPTVDLLERLDLDIEFIYPSVEAHRDTLAENRIPPEIKDAIARSDTVLFGASRGDGITYSRILRYLRTGYSGGLPANIRPSRYFDGAESPLSDPSGIDYMVVRENTPSPFNRSEGIEGDLRELAEVTANVDDTGVLSKDFGSVGDGTFSVHVASERNIRRLANIACEVALDRFDRRPLQVVSATKSTSLSRTHGLFDSIVEEVTNEFDSMKYDHLQVDNVAELLVTHPNQFDVIISPNAEGDILSDIGAGTIGGIGLAPSGCYGEEEAYFEPVHGTAPDIVGEGIINPTAMILTAAMMLNYLGFDDAADEITDAILKLYAEGEPLTPDQGGNSSTTEMVGAVARYLGI